MLNLQCELATTNLFVNFVAYPVDLLDSGHDSVELYLAAKLLRVSLVFLLMIQLSHPYRRMETQAASKMLTLSQVRTLSDRNASFIFQKAPHTCPFLILTSDSVDAM
jgi:hypothetical protein